MITYLIYISEAHDEFVSSDLKSILENSKTNNEGLDISGILLYIKRPHHDWQRGRFIQLLEGPKAAVSEIYNRIKNDSRHKNLFVLQKGNSESRLFPGWSMGFESIEGENFSDEDGLFSLTESFLDDVSENNRGLRLNFLKSFYELGNNNSRE